MIYDKIEILSLPKSFDLWGMFDYINPMNGNHNPDDILYDGYWGDFDSDHIGTYMLSATVSRLQEYTLCGTLWLKLCR